jgi:lactoylglutathione lyase
MKDAIITGFGHAGIRCMDLEKSKQFYMDILGFELMDEWYREDNGSTLCFLKNGDCYVELVYKDENKDSIPHGPINHLSMSVNDLEGMHKKLLDLGIEFEKDFISIDTGLFDNGARYLMFRGPNGERLQLQDEYEPKYMGKHKE